MLWVVTSEAAQVSTKVEFLSALEPEQANASVRRPRELHAYECRKWTIINGYRGQLQAERPLCRRQHESTMARLPMSKRDALELEDPSPKLTSQSAVPSLRQNVPIVEKGGEGLAVPTPSTYRSTSI